MILASPLGRVLSLLAVGGVAAIAYFGFISNDVGSSGSDSLYKSTNFIRALGAVRAKEGGGAPLLEVQVVPARAKFQVVDGARVRLYGYDAKSRDLEQIGVQAVDSTRRHQFSLRRVDPGVTERLARAVRVRVRRRLQATVMTLARNGALRWTIAGKGNGRAGIVFSAASDGTGLTPLRRFTTRRD